MPLSLKKVFPIPSNFVLTNLRSPVLSHNSITNLSLAYFSFKSLNFSFAYLIFDNLSLYFVIYSYYFSLSLVNSNFSASRGLLGG